MVEQGLKEAMQWINGELQDNPGTNLGLLIDRASQQFNLTPLQAGFLPALQASRLDVAEAIKYE